LDDAIADADLALIVTAHPGVDHAMVAQRSRLVLDLRGITRTSNHTNVVRL
jgi:UDP-N-acetyl-D-glucosamine dehydrogenase